MFNIIFNLISQSEFYNPEKASNGGGYMTPTYVFTFNGEDYILEDSSCGDFGHRFELLKGNERIAFESNMAGSEWQNQPFEISEENILLWFALKKKGYNFKLGEDTQYRVEISTTGWLPGNDIECVEFGDREIMQDFILDYLFFIEINDKGEYEGHSLLIQKINRYGEPKFVVTLNLKIKEGVPEIYYDLPY